MIAHTDKTILSAIKLFALTLLLLVSCNSEKNIHGSKKDEVVKSINFKNLNTNLFNNKNINILKHYLIGNPRWDFRSYHGKTYAIRRYAENNSFVPYKSEYVCKYAGNGLKNQSRVILSFGRPVKFYDYMDYTEVGANDKTIKIKAIKNNPESGKTGTYLIIKSELVNVEIFELSGDKQRRFTQQVINELSQEFYSVLKYNNEIEKNGVLPFPVYYPITFDSVFFEIDKGKQPGMYIAKANVKNNAQGVVYIKVFDKDSGTKLSAKTIKPITTRKIGWSANAETLFYYQSEFRIMVGALNRPFTARIEFWFKGNNGTEKKLFEKEMQVESWKRTGHN